MYDDDLNPMANDAGWPHIATDLRAENAKLCAKIERLRAALSWMDDHDPVLVEAAREKFGLNQQLGEKK